MLVQNQKQTEPAPECIFNTKGKRCYFLSSIKAPLCFSFKIVNKAACFVIQNVSDIKMAICFHVRYSSSYSNLISHLFAFFKVLVTFLFTFFLQMKMVVDTEHCKQPSSVSMKVIVSYFYIEMTLFTFINMFKCSVV